MDLRLLRYFTVVAEERHVGRAAARLHMTQPPLSRAMKQLESDLGVVLLERTHAGVTLTPAGDVLLAEARDLLEHAERLRGRVRGVSGQASLVVGSLADAADLVGARLVSAFRAQHPHVAVTVHEFDLGDPASGLRTGVVDVALSRSPFDTTGLRTHVLARQRIGVVVREDDPLLQNASVSVDALGGRQWVRLPEGSDPVWVAYWTGPAGEDALVTRTVQECLQAVLWNGMSVLAPLDQVLPPGLRTVPADDRAVNELMLVWRDGDPNPLVRSFVQTAGEAFRKGRQEMHPRTS